MAGSRRPCTLTRRPEERPTYANRPSTSTERTSALRTLAIVRPTTARSVTRTVRMRFLVGTGLVRDGDAPLREEIFHISEAQAETVIQSNGVTDDLRWESVSVVAARVGVHRPTLSAAPST